MSADLLPSLFLGLPTAHQDEIVKIRACLRHWLEGFSDDEMNISGARERFAAATQDLTGEQISMITLFTPSTDRSDNCLRIRVQTIASI